MGQAIDEVRAAAHDVTESVYDDGVAVELDRWFRDAAQ
jgi:hydroxymethylpyrimidine pyrophosphatase-like HAD family hydrolase